MCLSRDQRVSLYMAVATQEHKGHKGHNHHPSKNQVQNVTVPFVGGGVFSRDCHGWCCHLYLLQYAATLLSLSGKVPTASPITTNYCCGWTSEKLVVLSRPLLFSPSGYEERKKNAFDNAQHAQVKHKRRSTGLSLGY